MRHVEERLARSLTTRADDVRPDPATWARVEARLRRRAWVVWSAAGVTVAAALVLAALVLPGLFGQTRVDLSPADPPAPTGATMLVTTDGSRLQVTDLDGAVLADLDPPTAVAEHPPISRLAVRPGSTPDDLTVVYLRGDDDCERAELGWVTRDDGGIAGGVLGGGQEACVSDPVWSPDGDSVAWVESASSDEALALGGTLLIRCWGEEACQGHDQVTAAYPIDPVGLAQPQVPAGALRATDWWWELDGGPPDAVVSMSAPRADGLGQAYVVQVEHIGGDVRPDTTLIAADPSRGDGESVRPAVVVSGHDRLPGLGEYGYELGVDADGAVLLSRLADDAEPDRVPLDPDVLSAGAVDSGDAWLTARGDTVVFGTGQDAWVVAFDAGSYSALPGVAHAAVMAPTSSAPEPAPEPVGFPFVATDGEVLTVHGPDGPSALAEAQESEIPDVAVHPASTTDDLTVVWREGRGCTAHAASSARRARRGWSADGHDGAGGAAGHVPRSAHVRTRRHAPRLDVPPRAQAR